jgi:hypothetical protein
MLRGPDHIAMRTGACTAGPSDCAGEIASAIADRWFLTPARAKPFAGLAARSISHCEARETGRRLYLLFVREQRFMTEQDTKRKWQEDPEASEIFANAREKAGDHQPLFCYAVSESAAETIADIAATLGASLTNRQTRLYKGWLVTPSRR